MKPRIPGHVLFIQGGAKACTINGTTGWWKVSPEISDRITKSELAQMDDGAILIGHSIGGTVLINVLAEERLNWTLGGIF